VAVPPAYRPRPRVIDNPAARSFVEQPARVEAAAAAAANTPPPRRHKFTLRLTEDEWTKLAQSARRQNRSINGAICAALDAMFDLEGE
jgi:hypothetical protein